MKQLIVMAIAAMAIPVLAQNAPERPMRQRAANMQPTLPEEVLKKYDKDGDGKLSSEERAAMRADMQKGAKERRTEIFKTMDKDGDGKISLEEFLAAPLPTRPGMNRPAGAPEGAQARRGERPEGAQPPRGERPEGMRSPRGERPGGAALPEQMKKFDKDGDGKLSDAEREAMRIEMSKERRTRQFKMMDKEGKGYITLEEFTTGSGFGDGMGPARPGAPGGEGQGNRPAGRGARGPRSAPAAE